MTYVPPGGWCIDPQSNAQGAISYALLYGDGTTRGFFVEWLARVLGGAPGDYAKAAAAFDGALTMYAPQLDATIPEYGELVLATWAPTAVVMSHVGATLISAQRAISRLNDYVKTSGLVPSTAYVQGLYDLSLQHADADATAALDQAVLEARTDSAVVTSYAEQLYNQAIAAVQAAEAQATARVQAALDQAVLEARTDSRDVYNALQQVVAEVNTGLANEVAQVNSALVTLEQYIQTGLTQAEAFTQTATEQGLANERAAQSQQLITTLSPGWAGTAESANAATESLVTEHPEEAQNVELVPTATPPDLVTAVAGLGTIMKTVTQTLNDCALPNCNVKNKAASDLKNLFNAAGDGALLAFLVYGIAEPDQAAKDVERVLTPVGDGIVTAFRDLTHL